MGTTGTMESYETLQYYAGAFDLKMQKNKSKADVCSSNECNHFLNFVSKFKIVLRTILLK